MRKIYVYGCSFTYGNHWPKGHNDKGKDYLPPNTWPYMLDLGFDYQVINRSEQGFGWNEVMDTVLYDIPKYTPYDLCIIQVPYLLRLYFKYLSRGLHSKHDWIVLAEKGEKKFLDLIPSYEYIVNVWKRDMEAVLDIVRITGIDYYWWFTDKNTGIKQERKIKSGNHIDRLLTFQNDKYYGYENWMKNNLDIRFMPSDHHQNKKGHELQAEMFSRQIMERRDGNKVKFK
tara:strand:+ start:3482 stop:4168 length:687 start_codon:yes stop_codon:yes gene_type:complete